MLIKGYEQGSDLTVLNTIYKYPSRREDGKYDPDIMSILYRDNKTGEKKIEEIKNPDYIFYEANDDVVTDTALMFLPKDKVHEVRVPYTNVLKQIAEDTGNEQFFYDNIQNGNRRLNEALHTLNNIFGSDMHIEDHYRARFDREYTNETFVITKGYFDIEADTISMRGDFPELGECPINAITYIDKAHDIVYTFLLRTPGNDLIPKFENEAKNPKLFEELRNFIINHVGGEKTARIIHKIDKLQFKMFFYDNELEMIRDFFRAVHVTKPDFMLAWNMSFDIPYIIERIIALGAKPEDIMCPTWVKIKIAKYYIDEQHKNQAELRGDFFTITGLSVWVDQLVHFASRRKGQSNFERMSLDYIGEKIAKVGKLDYSHITTNIAKLPYLDYKTFVFYNIMDTIVQHCIENKVSDIDYMFNKCLINNTRYHKAHRQSIYLTNRAAKEFYNDGFIIGNNHNRGNEKPKEKYPGAMVGDPTNNSDYSKMKINDHTVNLANNLDDYDYKSLYPSIMRENNIAPNTQIGRILIEEQVHENENRFKYSKYCRGGSFVEDLQCQNYLEFCKRWFHFGGVLDVINDMKELEEQNKLEGTSRFIDNRLISFVSKGPRPLIYFEPIRRDSLIRMEAPTIDFSPYIQTITSTAQMDIDSIEEVMKRRQRDADEEEELNRMLGLDTKKQGGNDDQ